MKYLEFYVAPEESIEPAELVKVNVSEKFMELYSILE